MTDKKIGKQTFALASPPSIISCAAIGGNAEYSGPLGDKFDFSCDDAYFGESSWEKAECFLQKKALNTALSKASLNNEDLDMIFAGDLLAQCISSGFAMRNNGVPFFGVYGACSTMAESLSLAAMMIDGGYANITAAVTSSHFCSAERQFRTPLEYGGQRTPSAQRTATASGCAILSSFGRGPYITLITAGRIIDNGITDANNMGAAMMPAAYDTLSRHFSDSGRAPDYYDLIVTGDLGHVGSEMLKDYFKKDGIDISANYNDCGLMIFDRENQDVHAGGSGCGCSASVLCGHLLSEMREGNLNRILFAATGAMLSPVSSAQGESIPSICYAVAIENTLEVK